MLRRPPRDLPSCGGMQVADAAYQLGMRRLAATEITIAASVTL
jgi:hypothetical protein